MDEVGIIKKSFGMKHYRTMDNGCEVYRGFSPYSNPYDLNRDLMNMLEGTDLYMFIDNGRSAEWVNAKQNYFVEFGEGDVTVTVCNRDNFRAEYMRRLNFAKKYGGTIIKRNPKEEEDMSMLSDIQEELRENPQTQKAEDVVENPKMTFGELEKYKPQDYAHYLHILDMAEKNSKVRKIVCDTYKETIDKINKNPEKWARTYFKDWPEGVEYTKGYFGFIEKGKLVAEKCDDDLIHFMLSMKYWAFVDSDKVISFKDAAVAFVENYVGRQIGLYKERYGKKKKNPPRGDDDMVEENDVKVTEGAVVNPLEEKEGEIMNEEEEVENVAGEEMVVDNPSEVEPTPEAEEAVVEDNPPEVENMVVNPSESETETETPMEDATEETPMEAESVEENPKAKYSVGDVVRYYPVGLKKKISDSYREGVIDEIDTTNRGHRYMIYANDGWTYRAYDYKGKMVLVHKAKSNPPEDVVDTPSEESPEAVKDNPEKNVVDWRYRYVGYKNFYAQGDDFTNIMKDIGADEMDSDEEVFKKLHDYLDSGGWDFTVENPSNSKKKKGGLFEKAKYAKYKKMIKITSVADAKESVRKLSAEWKGATHDKQVRLIRVAVMAANRVAAMIKRKKRPLKAKTKTEKLAVEKIYRAWIASHALGNPPDNLKPASWEREDVEPELVKENPVKKAVEFVQQSLFGKETEEVAENPPESETEATKEEVADNPPKEEVETEVPEDVPEPETTEENPPEAEVVVDNPPEDAMPTEEVSEVEPEPEAVDDEAEVVEDNPKDVEEELTEPKHKHTLKFVGWGNPKTGGKKIAVYRCVECGKHFRIKVGD